MFRKKGQSMLEYIILLTAVVAGILIFVSFLRGTPGSSGLGKLVNTTTQKMESAGLRIENMTQ